MAGTVGNLSAIDSKRKNSSRQRATDERQRNLQMKKLTKAQEYALDELTIRPVSGYGTREIKSVTFEVLARNGYAVRVRGGWQITQAGCDLLHENKAAVDLRYAQYEIQHGIQIRHNVSQVEEGRYEHRGQTRLVKSYYPRTFEEEINAVHDYQMRAIELARAEIRAGLA